MVQYESGWHHNLLATMVKRMFEELNIRQITPLE